MSRGSERVDHDHQRALIGGLKHDLPADDASSRADAQDALLDRWIAENPPGSRPGWDPYPTSLRLVNWIKRAWMGGVMDATRTHSLAEQSRWLARRLEWHLLGNHLWANAKAMVFAGTYFDGDEARTWRRIGLRLVRRELDLRLVKAVDTHLHADHITGLGALRRRPESRWRRRKEDFARAAKTSSRSLMRGWKLTTAKKSALNKKAPNLSGPGLERWFLARSYFF